MGNSKIAFCNVSFGERYVTTQQRLKQSVLSVYPDAELFFWTNHLPPGSKPFQDSLYGFKVHAIKHARERGFTKVVWIDTCAVLKAPVEPLFYTGFIAVKDENKLYRYSSFHNIENKDWHLVGGSLYLFDFERPMDEKIFNEWAKLEEVGLFGTQEFVMNEKNDGIEKCGHRMDETCLAYVLYTNNLEPHARTLYDSIVEKKHFLEDGKKWYNVN